ncbi:GNAT family N-acetyltransferase [Actinoplanes bogorensis]|uniref:GNAT family N-acetyltransferase n=1 Tax=Paractinoplanes bogorensis TaxID=1610840 RepID=A0ABS5YQU6_9ACTN|nr:GNAT family N-acetyltransferase [Actinoplanes bogorensis]MBU2665814.1 GNAT family N-acetyltransferase [Actinoplanes bogorensis]
MQPEIRAYRPTDLDAVYDICVRTADAGGDARGQNSSDRLVGEVFAAPYVVLEPEVARILDDGHGNAVGYVVGTTDTAAFVKRYREEWLPATAGRYGEDPRDEMWLELHHDPERMLVPELAGYPAHLHIDLLPEWQGRGFGRGMMWSFLSGLHAAGAPRVHLGVAPANTAARAFYGRLGFEQIPVPSEPQAVYLGRSTAV